MVAHINATLNDNNTLSGGTIPHVGQFFFDQDLISQVEATSPYNTNKQMLITNAEDDVFGAQETEKSDSDPVLEYVLLGDDLSDGILAWVTVVVNQSATYDPTYSFTYASGGGVAESGGSEMFPPGVTGYGRPPTNGTNPFGGNGTMFPPGIPSMTAAGSATTSVATGAAYRGRNILGWQF